jgi:hypothetical protein
VEELMALSVDTECEIVSPLRCRIDAGNAGDPVDDPSDTQILHARRTVCLLTE